MESVVPGQTGPVAAAVAACSARAAPAGDEQRHREEQLLDAEQAGGAQYLPLKAGNRWAGGWRCWPCRLVVGVTEEGQGLAADGVIKQGESGQRLGAQLSTSRQTSSRVVSPSVVGESCSPLFIKMGTS